MQKNLLRAGKSRPLDDRLTDSIPVALIVGRPGDDGPVLLPRRAVRKHGECMLNVGVSDVECWRVQLGAMREQGDCDDGHGAARKLLTAALVEDVGHAGAGC